MGLILSVYVLASVLTFAVYGFDKHQAVCGRRRISERTLHGLELVGGRPGAILGQAVFRHKRRKLAYMVVFLGIIGLHVAGWVLWYREGKTKPNHDYAYPPRTANENSSP